MMFVFYATGMVICVISFSFIVVLGSGGGGGRCRGGGDGQQRLIWFCWKVIMLTVMDFFK